MVSALLARKLWKIYSSAMECFLIGNGVIRHSGTRTPVEFEITDC